MITNEFDVEFQIEDSYVGEGHPVYFIADIAANHDGEIERAKDLIYLAAESGADAAKFQHFKAETIVSDEGFKRLGNQKSHQSSWKKSVYEVYSDASVSMDWTHELVETCKKAGITFFTSPYDFDIVDEIDAYVPAYKIGSGDITWHKMIEKIAAKRKPFILATGASNLQEVEKALLLGSRINKKVALLQCNTNYTSSLDNFKYVNLNVLKTYREMFPNLILGLSDHTPGHTTVLGSIALGAKIIEKHFTDNTLRDGPDHKFSMDPKSWKEMVGRARELEYALGDGVKRVEENERETVILQRRSICSRRDLKVGHVITEDDLVVLRPCPEDGLPPYKMEDLIGKSLVVDVHRGDYIQLSHILSKS